VHFTSCYGSLHFTAVNYTRKSFITSAPVDHEVGEDEGVEGLLAQAVVLTHSANALGFNFAIRALSTLGLASRVTRKLSKTSANIWKFSQN
jgi:hypothetical protein